MAGEWMKIELALPDKPEVHYIANALNLDPDAVVGKLIRVWSWFDKHTEDGNAHGVTVALLDRLTGVTGFGEAMTFAGWMEQRDKTLHMPKFDSHTSESSKKRALTAKRVAKKRNADVTLTALPREEKIRDKTPLPPSGEFERFWQAWPPSERKQSKTKCHAIWCKQGFDKSAQAIIAHVEAMSRSESWTKEGGQFIPAPLVYLNQARWEGAEVTPLPARQPARPSW